MAVLASSLNSVGQISLEAANCWSHVRNQTTLSREPRRRSAFPAYLTMSFALGNSRLLILIHVYWRRWPLQWHSAPLVVTARNGCIFPQAGNALCEFGFEQAVLPVLAPVEDVELIRLVVVVDEEIMSE